jgi:hypothetical protein
MEGCLELKYNDSIKQGMSIDRIGKPGKTCVFDISDLKKIKNPPQGNNI